MIVACSTHRSDEKCVHNFGWKAWGEETTWKMLAWIVGSY